MDVPKSFKLEQNLEEYTDRLMKGEPKPKQKAELEDLLHEFDKPNYYESEFLHITVEELAIKNDYKLLKNQIPIGWDYWVKPKNKEESYLLIREHQRKIKHYSFATVENKNLEEFCKEFKTVDLYKKFYNPHTLMIQMTTKNDVYYPILGALSCMLAWAPTFIATHHMLETNNLLGTVINGISMFLGSYVGVSSRGLYNHIKNKKKFKKLYKELITDEKEAIKRALS